MPEIRESNEMKALFPKSGGKVHNLPMSLRISQIKPYANHLNEKLKGRHLSKLSQYAEDVYAFSLSRGGKLVFVLFGGDPCVYLSPTLPDGSSFSSPFSSYLRKTLSNATLEGVEAIEGDRILRFTLSSINEVFKPVRLFLMLELLPNRPNLILVDDEGKIEAAHRVSALSDPRPILRGVLYRLPAKNGLKGDAKEAPFDPEEYESACLQKEGELIARRKKQRFASLLRFLKTREKSLSRKISSIEQDRKEAEMHLDDGKYGDYLFMNYASFPKSAKSFDYEGETIPLDPRKSLSSNAEAFYKRAKKAKATLALEEENKEKAIQEREKIASLLAVLDAADESFLLSAEKEYGLSKIESKGISSSELSSSSLHPFEVTYRGNIYLFGKNAKQNDFLSFAYATDKSFLWLHVKGDRGAHVVLKKENPSNEEIAFACQLALLASKREEGEVMYCPRKNVKRGNVAGQAIVKEYRSATFRSVSPEVKKAFLEAKKAK